MNRISTGGVARYFVFLRKLGLPRSSAICKLREKYKKRGFMFFETQISWFKLFIPSEDYIYLQ